MKILASVLVGFLLAGCATDPNEGIFVVNGVTYPKLTEERLAAIRKVWTSTSQPVSEKTKAGREVAYWILDVIAHNEAEDKGSCSTLDLVQIQPREVGVMVPLRTSPSDTNFFRAATFHEVWVVNACGRRREWRVLDDSANPQNPLRVFRASAA